jgi:hypothetical protein
VGYEADAPKARLSFAVTTEQRAALARLAPVLMNGITVIKVSSWIGWLLLEYMSCFVVRISSPYLTPVFFCALN